MRVKPLIGLLSILFVLSACSEGDGGAPGPGAAAEPADLLLLNGYVYTVDDARSIVSAVAVRNGLIAATGSDAEMRSLQGPDTEVVDLAGRMVLPGLQDAHIHIFGIVEPDACSLRSQPTSLAEMVPRLRACVARYAPEPGEWLAVDMWNFAEGNQVSEALPTLRAALDAVSTDHPIILWGNDGHHGAANSRALATARDGQGNVVGLSAKTLETVFAGYRDLVGVDTGGEPNGELHEHARKLLDAPPRRDPAKLGPLLPEINRVLARNGITSVQDAALAPAYLPYLRDYEDSGAMRFRIQVANRLEPADYADALTGAIDVEGMLAELEAIRSSFADSELIRPQAVKIFADGVIEGNVYANPPSLPNAAVIEAYRQPRFRFDSAAGTVDVVGYVDTASPLCVETRAEMARFEDPAQLEAFRSEYGFHPGQCKISHGVFADPDDFMMEYVRRLDAAGFTIHIHAIGDRAVRVATDALEQVTPGDGSNPLRHGMAHLQLVHPADQRRIGAMGLYLAWTYAWMLTVPEYDMTVMPFIDDVTDAGGLYNPEHYAMKNSYPARSLVDAGAIAVAGSDAPVDDRSPRPFVNMSIGVTRQGEDGNVLNAEEALDIHQMIAAYTINGARHLNQEDRTGSIEPGKKADLAVLDHNIVQLYERGAGRDIRNTKVDFTFFEGEMIYRRE